MHLIDIHLLMSLEEVFVYTFPIQNIIKFCTDTVSRKKF